MAGEWHIVLRDIMVILAAGILILVSALAGLIAWRLYRIGRQLQADLQPVVDSLQHSADAVEATAKFMEAQVVSPAATAVGAAAGVHRAVKLARRLYGGLQEKRKGSGGS